VAADCKSADFGHEWFDSITLHQFNSYNHLSMISLVNAETL
jgi:hypothetical protein